ncbi:sensor histidine kinase [Acetobacter conturbans]|nr:sensor histidine kinase [Acetobacter conturbans]
MATVILGSVLPIAALGAILIWQDYVRLEESSTRRSEAVLSQLVVQLRQDSQRAAAMLDTIGQASDIDSMRRLLLLAQSASDTRYCLLAVINEQGGIDEAVSAPSKFPHVKCGHPRNVVDPGMEPVLLQIENGLAYLRVIRTIAKENRVGSPRALVAIQPFRWKSDGLDDSFPSPNGGGGLPSDALTIWFIAPDGTMAPVCPDCGGQTPPPALLDRLNQDKRSASQTVVSLRMGSQAYTYDRIPGQGAVLVEAKLLPEERRALWMLCGWIVMVVILLAAGLAGVVVAGRRLVIQPLRHLTDAVEGWVNTGSFDRSIEGPMPLEFRQLATAFDTATGRLARRERELDVAIDHQRQLMAEIHHRVKNNLQIIGSLLSLQANRTPADVTRAALLLARDRVQTLSMLHHYLYEGAELEGLDMEQFLPVLCEQLSRGVPDDVRCRVEMERDAGGVVIEPNAATPVVMIIAEAVSNALNYAFPGDRRGRVRVSLSRTGGRIRLIIEDNGIGISATRPAGSGDGLGLQLIRGFVRQIGGEFHIEEEQGTRCIIQWPREPATSGSSASHAKPSVVAMSPIPAARG